MNSKEEKFLRRAMTARKINEHRRNIAMAKLVAENDPEKYKKLKAKYDRKFGRGWTQAWGH